MDQSGFQTLRLETERLMFGECRVEADVLSFLGFYEIAQMNEMCLNMFCSCWKTT